MTTENITTLTVKELREKLGTLHDMGAIPPAAFTALGVTKRQGVFLASASKAECEFLLSSTLPGWVAPETLPPSVAAAPPAPSDSLAVFGQLGTVIATEIERATESGLKAVAAAAEAEIDRAILRALARLPEVGTKERTEMLIGALTIAPDSPANLRALARYCAPGRAKKPVRFAGEPGASKTYAARAFGRAFFGPGHVVDVGCHAGTTQREFLGAYVPFGSGFEKVLGKVSRAFSLARTAPTLLIVDEINRLPIELGSVFCSALNKQVIGGVESYVLDTGLPDGKGGTEEIVCPCTNLSVVSTMNEGAGYNTSPEDRAEMQRWVHMRCEYSRGLTLEIAASGLKKWTHLTGPEIDAMAGAMADFIDSARELALIHHRLQSAPTIRAVADTLDLADTPSEILPILVQLTEGWHCGINRNTGATEPEHREALHAAIKAAKFPKLRDKARKGDAVSTGTDENTNETVADNS
jgi:MoxR-like ATPase